MHMKEKSIDEANELAHEEHLQRIKEMLIIANAIDSLAKCHPRRRVFTVRNVLLYSIIVVSTAIIVEVIARIVHWI